MSLQDIVIICPICSSVLVSGGEISQRGRVYTELVTMNEFPNEHDNVLRKTKEIRNTNVELNIHYTQQRSRNGDQRQYQ